LDLRARLLQLIAPLTVGEEVLPGLVVDAVSAELGPTIRLRSEEGYLDVEVQPRAPGIAHVASTRRFVLSYRHRGSGLDLGRRACEALAARIADNEGTLSSATEPTAPRIREVLVDAVLEPIRSSDAYALNPYIGCLIGCRFCYAQSRLQPMRTLLDLPQAPWGSWVDVRTNAPEVLQRELQRLPPAPIKLAPIVTDPYHAAEARHRITRGCLEALVEAPEGFVPLLLTRSVGILEDLERLAALPRVYAGVSLPTVDDDVRRHFEPRSASIPERLDVLRRLRAAGIRTIAVAQPMLPGSVEDLAAALAEHCDSVSLDVLRGEYTAGPLFDAHPRARTEDWQADRASELAARLADHGTPVWDGELPPDLAGGS
jgi:DNA repair photolyase